MSDSTLSSRMTAVRHAIGDTGDSQRLIRTVRGKGVRFIAAVREVTNQGSFAPALPNKPSIVVLPFQSLSADPEQEYFAHGIVEEVITALSRMRWLLVIAHSSSSTYKTGATDIQQISRQLGVRYVLQGSVRKAANRVRISAQLLDASTAIHLWSDRFEGSLDDIFDLQDQMAASVVGAIAPELQQAEIVRARRKPTANLDAYDYFLRGIARDGLVEGLEQRTMEGTNEALRLFSSAIKLDPEFASAYGMAALCYAQRKAFGWMTDRDREIAEAARLARRGIEAGADDPVALASSGYVLAFVAHELGAGAVSIGRALTLNPNFAAAWLFSGWTKIWLRQPDMAAEDLGRAMRLSPLGRGIAGMQAAAAHAHFFAGRNDEASEWAARLLQDHPTSHPGLRIAAASHAAADRMEEAKKATALLRHIDPGLRVSNLRNALGPYQAQALSKYEEAIRKAGLPN